MSEDLGKAPEELDSEARRPGSAPAKKPLAEFLAEFETRLRDHPDEPATGALQVVEDRAAGYRRSPAQTPPARPASLAVVPEVTGAPEVAAIADAPIAEVPATSAAEAETIVAADAEATPTGGTEDETADATGESRRLRGRRRRKHRHRAH